MNDYQARARLLSQQASFHVAEATRHAEDARQHARNAIRHAEDARQHARNAIRWSNIGIAFALLALVLSIGSLISRLTS